MGIRYDRLVLGLTSSVFRRIPWLPGRMLKWLGFDLFTPKPYSARWARLGMLPVRLKQTGPWLFMDMGFSQQRHIYLTGRVEGKVSDLIARFVTAGSCYVDVGANLGVHVLQAAALVGEIGRCVAFEPNPEAFEILHSHVRGNRMANVVVHNLALGAVPGLLELNAPLINESGNLRLSASTLGTLRAEPGWGAGMHRQVNVVCGDSVLNGIPEDARGFCKIDVEGYEMEVVKGMQTFIATHPSFKYCIEMTDRWIRQASGVGSEELLRFFRNHGFVAYRALTRGRLVRLDDGDLDDQIDIAFIHQDDDGA